ncbi:MAG: M10 family metallopeptidase C-terminal domain-containing protein [Burkholderiales bacterium]|nr:M10 family metallopeptidase C-terminal domain-containing protein [Burkholderiales bacterium]
MAISSEDKTKLLKVVVGLFDAAPGSAFLPELEAAVDGGMSVRDVAKVLVTKSAFTDGVMGSATTPAAQAAILAGHFGLTADGVADSAASQAIDYFTAGIEGGADIGDLVTDAVEFLARTDLPAAFAETATLLANKAAVAGAYSANADNNSTDLTQLQSILQDPRITGAALLTQAEIDAIVNTDVFTLTSGIDVEEANVFIAPRAWTPGGNDQVNTLNDDDVLTAVGLNSRLDFNFVNDSDTGDNNIVPTLIGIETINVEFSTDFNATLDLQDSNGAVNVNLSRIDDGSNVTIDNITENTTNNLSINNSGAPDADVSFTYLATALAGTEDEVTLTLNNAQVDDVWVAENRALPREGFETFNLVSTGVAMNRMASLSAEDVQTLNISGDQDLEIYDIDDVTTVVGANTLVEAEVTVGGLLNMAGSLDTINAAEFTGDLKLNLNDIFGATLDGTSGTDIAVSVTGVLGNDTFWISDDLGANDVLDGGEGDNTLIVNGGDVLGDVNNIQGLEVRSQNGVDSEIDLSLFPELTDVTIRNEGHVALTSSELPVEVTLTNMTSEVAENGVTLLHGTTFNNDLDDLIVNASLETDGTDDSIVFTLEDGVNRDPRFNFEIQRTGNDFENITIEDNDTESNTIQITNKPETLLAITGGEAGDFVNLDYVDGIEIAGTAHRGVYGYDVVDADTVAIGDGEDDLADVTENTTQQVYTTVDNYGAGADGINGNADDAAAAAPVFVTETIDASEQISDLVVRVGSLEGQTILLGSGNDTVVFDASVDRTGDLSTEYAHAGLTNSDTVTGGDGTDTIVVDGESNTGISLQQSEWQNVTGVDQIYIASNNGSTLYANGSGFNYNYRLDITDQLIDSTDGGARMDIRNDVNRSDQEPNNWAHEAAGTRNANLLLDLTNISQSSNTVSYDGAEGGVAAALRVVFDDAAINGLHSIDGGDTDVNDLGVGNDNVIEVQNSATVTIADLAGLTNLQTLEFVNTLATDQTLNLDLNDTRLDDLIDSNHAASALEREAFFITTFDNPAANSALVLNTTNVTGNFDLTINTVGAANLANDTLRIDANSATDYTVDLGGNGVTAPFGDTVEIYGTTPGFVLTSTAATSFQLQYLDVLGNVTGVISDFANVEFLDLRNYTDAAGGAATNILVSGDLGATTIITTDGFSIGGSAGNDTIAAGTGAQVLTGNGGSDTYVYRAVTDSTATSTDIITDFTTADDVIDLSGIFGGGVPPAAITTALAALNGTALEFGGNEIAFFDTGVNTIVYVDVSGDNAFGAGDMQIQLTGTALGLVAADFVV